MPTHVASYTAATISAAGPVQISSSVCFTYSETCDFLLQVALMLTGPHPSGISVPPHMTHQCMPFLLIQGDNYPKTIKICHRPAVWWQENTQHNFENLEWVQYLLVCIELRVYRTRLLGGSIGRKYTISHLCEKTSTPRIDPVWQENTLPNKN